jgi:hypothetical protein
LLRVHSGVVAFVSLNFEGMFHLRSQLKLNSIRGCQFSSAAQANKITNQNPIVFAGKENIDQSPWKMGFLAKLVSIKRLGL